MENGPSTAADLADELGLTPAAVRRHLDQLVHDGLLEARDQRPLGRRGRGRPAKVFAVADPARDHFGHTYDTLAAEALRHLRATHGPDAITDFARARMVELEHKCSSAVDAGQSPISALAETLTDDGFAASVEHASSGDQLCQHHCPISHVAQEFPELCDAETEMIARVLGTHVQRLATIAHGDGVCTTHIPTTPIKKVTR
jgi:predicted ArsR family transcriptional regulator